MTMPRPISLCIAAAFLVAVMVLWHNQGSRSASRGTQASPGRIQSPQVDDAVEPGKAVQMSSGEVMLFLGRNAIGLSGFGPLSIRQALTNRTHFQTQARLLGGQKLYSLKTANASLQQFVVALSYYANKEVLVLGEPQEEWETNTLGPFDSTAYRTRFGAASAIENRLRLAGWHLLRLTDGTLMFVSDTDRKHLVDGAPLIGMPSSPSSRSALSPEVGTSGAGPLNMYE